MRLHQTQSFAHKNSQQSERVTYQEKKYFMSSKIDKELIKFKSKNNSLIKKWTKNLNTYISKDDIPMTNKKYSTPLIQKMQIKPQ